MNDKEKTAKVSVNITFKMFKLKNYTNWLDEYIVEAFFLGNMIATASSWESEKDAYAKVKEIIKELK